MIEKFEKEGANNWMNCIYKACKMGDLELVKHFGEKVEMSLPRKYQRNNFMF